MTYRLNYDRFNYMVFDISFNEIKYKLGDVFALHDTKVKWAEFWQPLDGYFFDHSDSQNVIKIPDITCWSLGDLMLNQKSYEALVNHLSPYGEFLPITVEGIPYWILHVTKFTDMRFVDNTKSERFIDEAQCINLINLSFKEELLQDLLIFRTEYSGYQNVYCTEKFKQHIESLGLVGLVFNTDLASIF
jgi:hypothetical protein